MSNDFTYPIDYDLYTTDEIMELADFLHLIEKYHDKSYKVDQETLIRHYKDFQSIINNKGEEKRIGDIFEKNTGISIYKTMKDLI